MIATASVELSDQVVSASTSLPLTVDGHVVLIGVVAGTRPGASPRLRDFGEALRKLLREGVLEVRVGKFVKTFSVGDLPAKPPDALTKVARGDVVGLVVSVLEPPACPVVLTVVVQIEEGPKPALN